jgi:MFS family permease
LSAPAPAGSVSPFVALRHRNFRLLWGGQLLSNAGTMMQNAAILWHVSLLVPESQRGIALGMVGLVRIVPIIVFSLIGGMVADWLDRRRLMLVTQTGMALTAGLLAWHGLTGAESLWPVYLLTAISAMFTSFDSPARQSLFPVLVPREHLSNAIS